MNDEFNINIEIVSVIQVIQVIQKTCLLILLCFNHILIKRYNTILCFKLETIH